MFLRHLRKSQMIFQAFCNNSFSSPSLSSWFRFAEPGDAVLPAFGHSLAAAGRTASQLDQLTALISLALWMALMA